MVEDLILRMQQFITEKNLDLDPLDLTDKKIRKEIREDFVLTPEQELQLTTIEEKVRETFIFLITRNKQNANLIRQNRCTVTTY